jgi:8-oxo-dGTP pyrophosphatase MutT (NUDIX family)
MLYFFSTKRLFTQKSMRQASMVLATAAVSGMTGYYFGTCYPSYNTSLSTLSKHQKTYRIQQHRINTDRANGRDSLWVSIFKPRYTGAGALVIVRDAGTDEDYLLITRQDRVVDGQRAIVVEFPSGFHNGPYNSNIPHAVAEVAEREIDRKSHLGLAPNHNEEYRKANERYQNGEIPTDIYVEDSSLKETAYRETLEEAGLDLKRFEDQEGNEFKINPVDCIDVPNAYVQIYLITFRHQGIPQLKKIPGDEVLESTWVNLNKVDLEKRTMRLPSGTYRIKPEVFPAIKKVVENRRTKSAQLKKITPR